MQTIIKNIAKLSALCLFMASHSCFSGPLFNAVNKVCRSGTGYSDEYEANRLGKLAAELAFLQIFEFPVSEEPVAGHIETLNAQLLKNQEACKVLLDNANLTNLFLQGFDEMVQAIMSAPDGELFRVGGIQKIALPNPAKIQEILKEKLTFTSFITKQMVTGDIVELKKSQLMLEVIKVAE